MPDITRITPSPTKKTNHFLIFLLDHSARRKSRQRYSTTPPLPPSFHVATRTTEVELASERLVSKLTSYRRLNLFKWWYFQAVLVIHGEMNT